MATPVAKPGYREFKATKADGSKILLSVRLPNQRELQGADMEASGAFNRALESGLPTRQRMIRRLKQSGLWSDKEQVELDAAREELGKAEAAVREGKFPSEDEKKEAEARLRAAQEAMAAIRNDFESMLAHTADTRADESRRNFLIACTVEHAEDDPKGLYKKSQRLWTGGVSEFLNDPDTVLGQRAVYGYLTCENDMPSEWTEADEKAEKEAAEKNEADTEKLAKEELEAAAEAARLAEEADKVTVEATSDTEQPTP